MGFPVINGGVLLLALAIFWLLLFRPNRTKRQESSVQLSVNAATSRRSIVKRLTGWSSLATFTISISSLFFIGQSEQAWIVTVVFAVLTVLLFASNLAAGRQRRKKTSARAKGSAGITSLRSSDIESMLEAKAQLLAEELAQENSREWNRQELPQPLYRSDKGTLEQPILAEVVSIEDASRAASEKYGVNFEENDDATRINLDEILRRRRANGN